MHLRCTAWYIWETTDPGLPPKKGVWNDQASRLGKGGVVSLRTA